MRKRHFAIVALALTVSACGWIEKQRERARRQLAETAFVALAESNNVEDVRAEAAKDRTLVNSVRTLSGEESSYQTESALTAALQGGRREMVDVLLELGADPNRADGTGTLPLSVAITAPNDHVALVSALLDNGADPLRADAAGETALHRAAGGYHAGELLPLILARARGTGGPNTRGLTPLHVAASAGSLPAIRLLIQKGVDLNIRTAAPGREPFPGDVAGATPLALVAQDRQIDAAATLCALGADPDLADVTGASARQVAVRVAAQEAAKTNPIDVDLARHKNMAAFLAKGAGCDALLARKRRGETIADAEVERIANESECAAGYGWGCGRAGWAYYKGEGARADAAQALGFFRRGCEVALTKNEWACGMVGILYIEGGGVRADPTEGARWLTKGCETPDPKRADAQSCTRLGMLLAEGRGVAKDLGRAHVLFRRACDAKYESACANLERYGS
jgi:TPR repeat protein